jgi:hypothetical protein
MKHNTHARLAGKNNALPDNPAMEVYESTDFKRSSQKNQTGCPTWIRTNFQGVLTASHDCL